MLQFVYTDRLREGKEQDLRFAQALLITFTQLTKIPPEAADPIADRRVKLTDLSVQTLQRQLVIGNKLIQTTIARELPQGKRVAEITTDNAHIFPSPDMKGGIKVSNSQHLLVRETDLTSKDEFIQVTTGISDLPWYVRRVNVKVKYN